MCCTDKRDHKEAKTTAPIGLAQNNPYTRPHKQRNNTSVASLQKKIGWLATFISDINDIIQKYD